jgi:hypothetical protein
MLDKLSVFFSNILPSQERGRKSLKYRGETCLNCGQKLDKSDRFCPNCSQLNSTKKLHFKDLFKEFFGSIFAYDSRIMLTLRALLFSPGKISKEYVEGRRMRYANPFRFYLSVSIIFFLLSGLISKITDYTKTYKEEIQQNTLPSNIKTFDDEATAKIVEEALKESNIKIPDSALANISAGNFKKIKKEVTYHSEATLDTMYRGQKLYQKTRIYNDFYSKNNTLKPHEALFQIGHHNNVYNRWLYKKVIDFNFFKENPDVAYNYFISKLPVVIFLFMPIFALFIKLIYIRKNKYSYMEHLVFAFHVQSMLFVLLIFSEIFDYAFVTSLFTSLAMFVFAFYLYKAMRRFYEQGRFKTLVKFMILNSLFTILASFAAIGYALISFSLY